MPPIVIDVARADDARDVVHRAVQALAEGQLVALPTETVYAVAASATHQDAVASLAEATGHARDEPLTLAVKSADDAEDYVAGISPIARRLARRCWPGPVTLLLEASSEQGLVSRLPEATVDSVCPNGLVSLRSPANQMVQDILRMVAGPIVMADIRQPDGTDATTAGHCVEALGERLALVLDEGSSRYGQPSSVVQATGNTFEVVREGVVGRQTLDRLSRYLVVFVCTGNTCRSPMAEALMRRALASRLGIDDDELESRGVMVASAGIAAGPGAPASRETAELMRERGVPVDAHGAQQLTEHLARQADSLVAMTPSHVETILHHWPDTAPRVKLVDPSGGAISDPIGGTIEVYRRCAEQIERGIEQHAEAILAELGLS